MNRGLGFGFGLISSSNIAGDPAAAPLLSENFEGTGTPTDWTTSISGSGTVNFDATTYTLEGSKSLSVYSHSGTYAYVDLGAEYDHIVATFGYRNSPYPNSLSNRQDVHFMDNSLSRGATGSLQLGGVSGNTFGIAHSYGSIKITLSGSINTFHYVRVEINRSGGILKIARSNDKTFPTSGTNYAEDLTASFNGGFTATRYISFGGSNSSVTRYYDDLEVTNQ